MAVFKEIIKGIELQFITDTNVFSPKHIDKGTRAMLEKVEFKPEDKVLDLGCGYGVVGMLAAKIIGVKNVCQADIDDKAVELARQNSELNNLAGLQIIKSDGFRDINETNFTLILSNPPYHTDFSVARHFIEKGFNRLSLQGKMYLVTRRKKWYKNKLIAIFGGVKIWEVDGYYVFMAEKRDYKYASKK